MRLSLRSLLLLSGILIALASWSAPKDVSTIDARSLGYSSPLDNRLAQGWQSVVKAANLGVNHSISSWLPHSRVRVNFGDGGWIEFQPSAQAVADDSLPPMLAMQFATKESRDRTGSRRLAMGTSAAR